MTQSQNQIQGGEQQTKNWDAHYSAPAKANTVWYSHPRTYGKGALGWLVRLFFRLIDDTSFSSAIVTRGKRWEKVYCMRDAEVMLIRINADMEIVKNSRVTGDKKKSGIIRKYGLNMSRQAFREKAADIGFVKVSSIFRLSRSGLQRSPRE